LSFSYRVKKFLDIVSEEEIEKIHEATLEILNDVGLVIMDRYSLQLLEDAGCNVDFDKQIVRFSPELVENSIKKCPSDFVMHARNPKYDLNFNPQTVYFGGCGGMNIYDSATGEVKKGTTKEAKDAVILCDALDNIARRTPGVGFLYDVPKEIVMETLVAISLKYSEKITTVYSMGKSAEWGIRMAEACGEDILVGVSSASPLGWDKSQIDILKFAVKEGLPLNLQSQASPGAVAPATLAGSLVVMNAEVLGLTVLIELLRPNTPVMYSCFSMPIDMRSGSTAGGAVEFGMLTAISAQIARYYKMTSLIYQPQTDSKVPDEQAGYEKALQWALSAMSGINCICGAGIIDGQNLWSKEQLLIDAEIAGMVGRLIEGITITDETLAMDLIKEVGHFPAHYLGKSHTRRYWKSEQFIPVLSVRGFFDEWFKNGSKTAIDNARERAEEILKNYEPVPLPSESEKELDKILKMAAKSYGISE